MYWAKHAKRGGVDRCNNNGYINSMRTSCRFAVAVHVLAVLAYREGEPVTSALLAGSVNTNAVQPKK